VPALVAEGAKLRPTRSADPVTAATKASLSSLAHRIEAIDRELAELDERIEALLVATVPDLLDLFGVGPDTAAALVMAAGDNPERLHSQARRHSHRLEGLEGDHVGGADSAVDAANGLVAVQRVDVRPDSVHDPGISIQPPAVCSRVTAERSGVSMISSSQSAVMVRS